MDPLDKGMIYILENGSRFHHATQNGVQVKIDELFLEFSV